MKYTPDAAASLATRFLQPGDSVLEIGAADGEHTRVYAERVGQDGYVLAVEPNQQNVKTLKKACRVMPWVTVWSGAVGARAGEAVLQTSPDAPKTSSLWASNVAAPGEAYPVAVTTVDALVQSMPRAPRLLHVDAQGAEVEILRGATKTLTLPIVWVVEVWPLGLMQAGASVAEVFEPFHRHAYTPHRVSGKRVDWEDALGEAIQRVGAAHVDLVMVPEDLMEADW